MAGKPKDYTGQRFGRWIVVERIDGRMWRCQCDCGNQRVIYIRNAIAGKTRSCGCLKLELQTTHGMTRTPAYWSWRSMRDRCLNTNSPGYIWYGARGIKICERWSDFVVFLADMGERPPGTTLDRIDVNGNYEPGNCRWADEETQQNNKRAENHRLITIDGETKTQQQWCRQYGVGWNTVKYRLQVGYSIEQALSQGSFYHLRDCKDKANGNPAQKKRNTSGRERDVRSAWRGD